MSKQYAILNYGCQMNESDAEHYAGQLQELGYTPVADFHVADVILVNTCCVRESAEKKIAGKIGELKAVKAANPNVVICVAGCMAQKDGEKYYGVSVYNRWTNGKTGILADVGYMYAKNELTQHIGNSEMETDVKTNSLTAGVRAEQLIKLGRSNMVPFVGVRYMYLRNGEYTLNENGSDGRHYAPKNQNIITPQVGVAWNGEFTIPGSKWTFRPSVEGGYLWNIGDRDTESIVSFGGASDTIGYEVADKSSYFAKLGIDFRKGNLILGVSFKYQKGDTVTNKKWNFNVNFIF